MRGGPRLGLGMLGGGGGGGGRMRRNMNMGRGGGGGGGGTIPPQRQFVSGRLPFDMTFCDDIFPRAFPLPDDTEFSNAILKRHADLTPSTEELQSVQNMITRIQGILETLILTPGNFDACQVDEVRQVGSFKHGTILAGHKTADMVVILKTLPTREAVEALCNKVSDELKLTECVRSSVTNRGFDIIGLNTTLRILITTIPPNLRKLVPDIHLDPTLLNEAWQAIRHSRWFEENAHSSTIKVLIRIFRDMRQRFPGFGAPPTWMFDLLCHYATMNNPMRQALPVSISFRRALALMAGGLYLPGYSGASMSHGMTYEEQDMATATAQTLISILGHGGYRLVLGIEPIYHDILTTPTNVNGILIKNPEIVYSPPAEGEGEEDLDDDSEDQQQQEGQESSSMDSDI